ncbi:DUF6011 domain-containing protein [Streptomyces sp. SID161]|uniref:DUF6011 domain-containing protein n=1 Tax=Streptomyces sp. SID161 TaxID=2690251 RepID=UPI00136FA845|nr:DUF6011 domain-containing protein [Streptomyces sp. SID161]MYW49614.1 hypothetical protein [Streptomyces sp. SID161]
MAEQQQEALSEQPRRRRVWCRGCRRELTDREARLRGWGRECDPDQRTRHDRHDVDQEQLPGF